MRRREVIAGLAGTAVVWPFNAGAQQQPMPIIGFLNATSFEAYASYVASFRDGLKSTGYVEAQNVLIEYRWADNHIERLSDLAAELVAHQVTVIAATGTSAAVAAKAATATIPIVFTTGSNPVELGLVESLSRPGGNLTGASQITVEVAPKRLELLQQLVPSAKTAALLVNPAGPNTEAVVRGTQAAADALGINLRILAATTQGEIDAAFAQAAEQRVSGVVISGDPLFNSRSEQLGELTLRYKMPTIYQYRAFTAAGGLVAYSGSITSSYFTAGVLTGRILKGEKPADLPVHESTSIELIVNLKTANAIGLTVPPTLLARADEVIE
jgi:putative ABC transport system substrate-binding protein